MQTRRKLRLIVGLASALALGVVGSAKADRRRPVRMPSIVPGAVHTVVPAATPQTDLTITNHGSAATFANCYVVDRASTCKSETLQAGQTATYADLGARLGSTTAGRIVVSGDHPLEVRSNAYTVELLAEGTIAQAPFTNDLTRYENTLVIGTTSTDAVINLVVKNTNGITLASKSTTLASWSEIRSSITDMFGIPEQNQQQVQLTIASGEDVYAAVEQKNRATGKLARFPVKTRHAGQWFLNTTPATRAVLINDQETNVPEARLLILAQQNDSAPFRTTVVNAFHTYHFESQALPEWIGYGPFGTDARNKSGTTLLRGVPNAQNQPMLFLAWGFENDTYVPAQEATDGAIGSSSIPGDATVRKAMSFNQSGSLRLTNASIYDDTVTGKIIGFDSAGNQTSSQDYALRNKENKDFALVSARSTITVNDAIGSGNIPLVIGTLQNENGTCLPYLVNKPIDKVTGEEVAQKFFDPWVVAGGYYLNNDITRCMISGSCGVPSVKSQLADIYTRGIGETWNKAIFETWLTVMADGITNSENIELWSKAKPRAWNNVGVGYSLTRSQLAFTNEPGGIRLDTSDLKAHVTIDRSFIVKYFDTNPAKGCGTATTGPSLDTGCPAYSFGLQTSDP